MKHFNFDSLGGVASAACIAHCFIVSLAPSLLSNLKLLSSYNEILEWSFFGFAISFALISAIFGFNMHKNYVLMSSFTFGMLILILGRCSEAFSLFEGGDLLSIFGGLILFGSHFFSLRCCRAS